jgi:hypothetical protein
MSVAGEHRWQSFRGKEMIELVRVSNPLDVVYITALLRDAGIETVVFDGHISSLYGAVDVMPQRIMVIDDDLHDAWRVLDEAGVEYPKK